MGTNCLGAAINCLSILKNPRWQNRISDQMGRISRLRKHLGTRRQPRLPGLDQRLRGKDKAKEGREKEEKRSRIIRIWQKETEIGRGRRRKTSRVRTRTSARTNHRRDRFKRGTHVPHEMEGQR